MSFPKPRLLILSGFISVLLPLAAHAGVDEWFSIPREILENQKLSAYKPSQQIQDLAETTTMTDYARRLWYLNQPTMTADKSLINSACRSQDHGDAVLFGCYLSGDQGIYILNMTDPRLVGFMNATVAHEVLHAGYARLTNDERVSVDRMLMEVYNGPNNQALEERLRSYQGVTGKSMSNELHSIVGTEIKSLPPALESYYAKYFKARAVNVAFFQNYQTQYDLKNEAVKTYDEKLDQLAKKMTAQKQKRAEMEAEIQSYQNRLDYFRQKKDAKSHNALIDPMNRKIDELKSFVTVMQSTIKEYNQLVERRNAIVTDLKSQAALIKNEPAQ